MTVFPDTKISDKDSFSTAKLEKAKFFPLVNNRMFHLMFSSYYKKFLCFFLSDIFKLRYEYVYRNLRIDNSIIQKYREENNKNVDMVCFLGKCIYIISINNDLSDLKSNKIFLYNLLGGCNGKIKCVYLININNFFSRKAEDTLEKEESVIKRNGYLSTYGKDYEIYNIFLPLIKRKFDHNNKLEKWEEFLLVTLLDDSDKLNKIIEKDDIYMSYRKSAYKISNLETFSFAWKENNYNNFDKKYLDDTFNDGIVKGIKMGKNEIVKNMYNAGISTSDIASISGYDEDYIESILPRKKLPK